MARGLSDNQKALLAYLQTLSEPTPEWVRLDALCTERGWPFSPFRRGEATQATLRKYFKESLGKVIADGNMSRMCHALRVRQLLVINEDGLVQLPEYVSRGHVTFEKQTYDVTRSTLTATEALSWMTQATNKALEDGLFGEARTVTSRSFWKLIRVSVQVAHEEHPDGLGKYHAWDYTKTLSGQMTKWKRERGVEYLKVTNPHRWGRKAWRVWGFYFPVGLVL